MENAPYDPADWMGPWRGYITEKANGPAGRAMLAAMGVPPDEVPPAPARVLVIPFDIGFDRPELKSHYPANKIWVQMLKWDTPHSCRRLGVCHIRACI